MRTDGEIDRLLREEGERWRGGVAFDGDVDAGRFTDGPARARWPGTLFAAVSTLAVAAVFVAVIGSRWLPVVEPDGTATLGVPGAEKTADPLAGLHVVRPGDTVTGTGAITVHQSGDTYLCDGLLIATLPAGVPVDAGCYGAQLVRLTGVSQPPNYASIVGIWDGEAVEVTEITPAAQPRDSLTGPIPCEEPAGGWPGLPDEEAAGFALESEVTGKPDRYVGLWSSRNVDGAGETLERAIVVGTVGDIDSTTERLTEVYPFNLCVVEVEYSAAELQPVLDELEALDRDWLLSIEPEVDRVVVSTIALEPVEAEAIVPFLDKVEIRATLTPIRTAPEPTEDPIASQLPAPSACRPEPFLQLMRRVLYDYDPIGSPRELAGRSDLVVIGRVVAGTAVASEPRGFETHLAVHVNEVVRGNPDLVVEGRIFVVAPVDVSAMDVIHDVSGCDVLLFLTQRDPEPTPGPDVGPGFFTPFVQGFWIQSEDGLIGVHESIDGSPPGWHDITSIDDLRNEAG